MNTRSSYFFTLILYFFVRAVQGRDDLQAFEAGQSKNLSFYLITRDANQELEMTKVSSGAELEGMLLEDRDNPLFVLLHGLGGSYNHTSNHLLANALFEIGEKNVVAVDYESLVPGSDYNRAAQNTILAGKEMAGFLSDVTMPLQLIGFSLGAHVAAVAAYHLTATYNQPVSTIIGLDPANPIFESLDKWQRLDNTDADFVMVIHTAGGAMGGLEPLGHVDFYPNGGLEPQPQCALDNIEWDMKALVEILCSHSAAYYYLADSIHGGYTATRCSSWQDYLDDQCLGEPTLHMGFQVPRNSRGSYYLRTRAEPPLGDPDVDYPAFLDDTEAPWAMSDSEKQSDCWTLLTGLFIITGQIVSIYIIYHYTPH